MRLSSLLGREVRRTPALPWRHLMKASRRTLAVSSRKETLPPVLLEESSIMGKPVVDWRFRTEGLRSR